RGGELGLFLAFDPLADPEDVAVGMPHVHLAHAPRHVRRRPSDGESLSDAVRVHRVDVVDPDRHPHALLLAVVAVGAERPLHRAPPASALAVLAEEDLARARAHAAEPWRIAPVPDLLPAELLEPFEGLSDVGDVQDRRQAVGEHARILDGLESERRRANVVAWISS